MKILKIIVIRWAVNKLAQILRKNKDITYEGLGKYGVHDFSYNKQLDEFNVIIK